MKSWHAEDEDYWASVLAGARDYTEGPWYQERDDIILEIAHGAGIEAEVVVDLCAAPARLARGWLGEHRETGVFWAIDWSPSGVALMRQRIQGNRFYAVCADCCDLDALGMLATVDVLICTACEHVPAEIPARWVQALRPGAWAVLCWSSWADGTDQHISPARSEDEARAMCGAAAEVRQVRWFASDETKGKGQWIVLLRRTGLR